MIQNYCLAITLAGEIVNLLGSVIKCLISGILNYLYTKSALVESKQVICDADCLTQEMMSYFYALHVYTINLCLICKQQFHKV